MPIPSFSAWPRKAIAACTMLLTASAIPMQAFADSPGRGPTGPFEIEYLQFIIDHHYGALRMTELAAGTDATRDAAISPTEGTAPTPQTTATPAKAQMADIKSMARQENRTQREEILKAQHFLRDWYGMNYQPRLRPSAQTMIATLQSTPAGANFDQAFLRSMSSHHFMVLAPTDQCLTGADVAHDALERYCKGIHQMQLLAIDDMRHMLCEKFNQCDFQPFTMSAIPRE